ncbi:MAG: class I SAM-dependent methyltransferase [Pseudomonadota bacterium]
MNVSEKWNRIFSHSDTKSISANEVLEQNSHLLPKSAKALDLACGLGGNALLLAEYGLMTHAWDISSVAIEKLEQISSDRQLSVKTQVRDIEKRPPEEGQFDVITVGNFLNRSIFSNLIDSLRVDGLLFYQTFVREKVDEVGPSNLDYLLKTNELLHLCKSLKILVYREEAKQGDLAKGWRNQAMIVAQKSSY